MQWNELYSKGKYKYNMEHVDCTAVCSHLVRHLCYNYKKFDKLFGVKTIINVADKN
jgi:hypothetical protein